MPKSALPQNIDAEQRLIGAILIDNQFLSVALNILETADFYTDRFRTIFQEICALAGTGSAVDILTLSARLDALPGSTDKRSYYDDLGRDDALFKLMEACLSPYNAAHYARIVKDCALKRLGMERHKQGYFLLRNDPDGLAKHRAMNGHMDFTKLLEPGGQSTEDPFSHGLIRASALDTDPPDPVPLWFAIYRGKVCLMIGETGAGKSSLLYNMAIHAARNEPLWQISFGLGRPLKVLYIDPENAGNFDDGEHGLCAIKVKRIGQGWPESLMFHQGQDLNLSRPDHMAHLEAYITRHKIDMVILDPIANLFSTKDENDNAEAAKQMIALTSLSRKTGAAVVIVHHTGKDTSNNYGRGASARLAAADTALVLRARSSDDANDDTYGGAPIPRSDECRLQVIKNRIEGKGSLYLRMAGEDRFERSSFPSWKGAGRDSECALPKPERLKEEIMNHVTDGAIYATKEIVAAMKEEGYGVVLVSTTLAELVKEGRLRLEKGARNANSYRASSGAPPAPDTFPVGAPRVTGDSAQMSAGDEEDPYAEPSDIRALIR